MKTLVVDDNRDNVELLCQILEDNYDVITAYNGPDCIKLTKEQKPDLIILDVMMPEMDGYEVMERLREDESTKDIPVIFLSARYRDIDRITKGLELGAYDYITKPVEDEILLAKIRNLSRIIKAENEIKNQRDELVRLNEDLKEALSEKVVLLRELYHRTKNSMQDIISMLHLQAQNIKDDKVLEIFKETENRINSMALVHEKLYQTRELSRVDLKQYFEDLLSLLQRNYQDLSGGIRIKTDMDHVSVPIDYAIPCGLIVNELISNSFKHAFPGDKKGEIRIGLKSQDDKEIEILVTDNGVGMPKDFKYREANSFGIQTIIALTEHQLQGKLNLNTDKGTEFQIRFKATRYQERV